MYKIALCDDNREYLNIIGSKVMDYCRQYDIPITLHYFYDSDLLAEQIEENKLFDAYLLDIEMPNVSGVRLAEKLKEYSDSPFIIFLTAYEAYAVKACGMDVLGYVLKSQPDIYLKQVLDRLFARLGQMEQDKTYIINNQRKYIKLRQQNILYIYKNQKNAVFVLRGKKEEWDRIPLQNLYQKLDNPEMVMLDRGIILNMRHIQKVIGDRVVMEDGYELITGKKHIADLKKQLSLYWERTL